MFLIVFGVGVGGGVGGGGGVWSQFDSVTVWSPNCISSRGQQILIGDL